MNPELPPLRFPPPLIKARRRQRPRKITPPGYTLAQRKAVAQRVLAQIATVDAALAKLSPDEKRAVFLKLQHDRPLVPKDLVGTGLSFMSEPGDSETLVIPKADNLGKLATRAQDFEAGSKATLLKNPGLLTILTDISAPNPKERLSDELRQSYEEDIKSDHFIYEIEIASQAASAKKHSESLEAIIKQLKATFKHGTQGAIYDTDYLGSAARLVVWTKGSIYQHLVDTPEWWRVITVFELRPRFETMKTVFDNFSMGNITVTPPLPDAETICVIDSGIAIGNPFLQPITKAEASRSWVYGASPTEDLHSHGSGVASLAAYHTINLHQGDENTAAAWVVSARIMTDEGDPDSPRIDDIIEDRKQQSWLLSNILREIVETYVPQGIRIYLLAFQIHDHIWSRATRRQVARNAWLARAIDHLSLEFDVVFVCVTGNIPIDDAHELSTQPDSSYPRYLFSPLAKLLDPGPAALAVTCGAIAHSTQILGGDHGLIAQLDEPSPFTRSGPGFGDSIKPDVVERGGSLVRHLETGKYAKNIGTEVVIASNQLTPALTRAHGTSYAAPRVAYHLAQILRDTRSLGIHASAPLLRAFLAVSCTGIEHPQGLTTDEKQSLTGHGLPNGSNALLCQPHSALLYWQGEAGANSTAILRIHVPPEIISAGQRKKRITIAVASAPPVQRTGLSDYLGARMKFWLYRGDKPIDEILAQHQREEQEANEAHSNSSDHLVCEIGITARSHGTLQRDTFEWSRHQPEFSQDDYTLAIALTPAAWLPDAPIPSIPLAVVVRIEETSGQFQQLYAQVSARVRAKA